MIIPINSHFIIEPVVHESFVSQSKENYDEIGVVTGMPEDYQGIIKIGSKVYFDSWLIGKYPTGEGKEFWLIKHEDIRAIEN